LVDDALAHALGNRLASIDVHVLIEAAYVSEAFLPVKRKTSQMVVGKNEPGRATPEELSRAERFAVSNSVQQQLFRASATQAMRIAGT